MISHNDRNNDAHDINMDKKKRKLFLEKRNQLF